VPIDVTDFDFGNYVTVSAWFNTTERPTSNKGLVAIDEASSTTWKALVYMSDSNLSFGVRHPGGTYSKVNYPITPAGSLADGAWHHVVGTFNRFAQDGVRIKLYVDGQLVLAAASIDLPILRGESRLAVGKYGSQYYKGHLDEINVFNYAMTASEVLELYNNLGNP